MFSMLEYKPRIIPFKTLRDCEKEPVKNSENRKVLLFKVRSHLIAQKLDSPEHCKLDFILDHLP